MSEQDKTNELDSYGVWVKTPPKTIDSSETQKTEENVFSGTEDDLPDFSALDVVSEQENQTDDIIQDALSSEELSAISTEETNGGNGEMEEISLDEFIDGGIFDSDKEESSETENSSVEAAPSQEQSDDFSVGLGGEDNFDEPAADDTVISNAAVLDDDQPFDIDLSFEDDDSFSAPSSSSQAETSDSFETESIDLSEFGFDDADGSSASESQTETVTISEESNDSSEISGFETESVDLSEFGFDDSDTTENSVSEENQTVVAAEEQDSAAPEVTETESEESFETESVDLSEFGFDDSDENTENSETGAVEPSVTEEISESEEEIPSLQENSEENISVEENVSFDDDISFDEQTPSDNLSDTKETEILEPQTDELVDLSEFGFNDTDESEEVSDSIEDDVLSSPAENEIPAEKEEISGAEVAAGAIGALGAISTISSMEEIFNSMDDEKISDSETEETAAEEISELENNAETENEMSDSTEIPEFSETSETTEEFTEADENAEIQGQEELPSEEIPDSETEEISDIQEIPEIPDTFDEETSSILDNEENEMDPETAEFAEAIQAPILDDEDEEESRTPAHMTAIFSQIVDELSELKAEIASLKNDLHLIRTNNTETLDLPTQKKSEEETGGFFSDSDKDETIALSSDELDNILNNADFTESEESENQEIPSEEIAAEAENEEDSSGQIESEEAEIHTPAENLDDVIEELEEEQSQSEIHQTEENDSSVLDTVIDEISESEENYSPKENIFGSMENEVEIPFEDEFENNNLEMDFQNESLEEPELDNISYEFEKTQDENLPEEISVPKADEEDIFVESSTTDFVTEEENLSETESDENAGEETDGQTEMPSFEEEPLTEEKLSYLNMPIAPAPLPEEEIESAEDAETLAEEVTEETESIPKDLKTEIKSVLSYMDQLLDNLPEEKIEEFAKSEQFDTYKKLFKELGLA